MASSSDEAIEIAALGRPFQLGMLYDCRKDTLIPGITLWDQEQLQKNTSVQQRNKTEFNVTTSDSIEDKSNSLQISDSLKLSILGGLVDVGGSAKYFKDTKESQKQVRLTLQYKTTTQFETLTMSHLGLGQVSHPNVFEEQNATHVVTAIWYGAGAYFVFDRESSSQDEKELVEGEAKLTFNKLKFLKVDAGAEASLNMDDVEKSAVEKFSCTFHGDFKLTTNPTSFSDAVRVYRHLPKMLGENGEHAVPLRVWLYPLRKLDSRAARLVRDVSNDLIRYSSDTIECFTKTEIRCKDVLKDTPAATYPALAKNVRHYMEMCHHYKTDLMQKFGSVLPLIRGGGKEESALEDILKAHDNSPFNNKDLDPWLTNKEKESDTLKTFLKPLKNIGVSTDDKLADTLFESKFVVCFSFTSINHTDHFLEKLSNYLKPSGVMDSPKASSDLQAGNTEWLSTDTKDKMMAQFTLFEELKTKYNSDDTKFITDSTYNECHPGACILIYEDGSANPVHFVPPSKPATPTATDVSHDNVTVKLSDPDSATVYRVEYREKQIQDSEWKFQPVQKNQEAVTLSGLKPETEYEIRATALGKLGYAVNSEVCSTVTPKATPSEFKDIISKSDQIRSGCPAVYQLKPKKEKIETLTRMTVGEKNVDKINKTILLVGETGSGKSTLINALVNYAMGVKWEDEVWFQIVEDETRDQAEEEKRSQTESQTSDVTVYEIFGFEGKTLPYSLTIIDTPGFGDTRGTGRDDIVCERLLNLFKSKDGVKEVNAVALVLKASENRVSDRMLYVLNSVMSLFGKDMWRNIVTLFTHSTGDTPENALEALKTALNAFKIQCAKNNQNQPIHFLFDNSQSKPRTEKRSQIFSERTSKEGMEKFTTFLEESTAHKLEDTVNVLDRRIRLTACIQNLHERMMLIELKQKAVEQTQKALTKCEEALKNDKNFSIKVDEPYKELTRTNHAKATRCTVCEENCHYPGCTIAWSPSWCEVMSGGNCTSCTKRCPVSVHERDEYIYVVKTRTVKKTLDDLKEKYEKDKRDTKSILENLEDDKNGLTTKQSQLLEEAYQLVVKLDEIALNSNSLSTHVHLDFLIEKMKEKGDTEKVQKLEEILKKLEKLKAAMSYKRKRSKL